MKPTGIPMTRTQSRAASLHESFYINRVSFMKRVARKVGFKTKISMRPEELHRFTSIQTQRVTTILNGRPSQTANG
jgi:H+-transporting ATPase